jgi:hypothetical protein
MSDERIDYRRDIRRHACLQEAAAILAPELVICDACQRRTAEVEVKGYANLCRPCDADLTASIGMDS